MENKIALAKSIVSNHFTFYGGVMITGNPTERNDIEQCVLMAKTFSIHYRLLRP